MTSRRPPAGFTLVEILASIAIIVLLAATILPAYQSMLESARLTTCTSRLHNLHHAIVLCANDSDGYLPCSGRQLPDGSWEGGDIPWQYALAPYFGAKTADGNGAAKVGSAYACPSRAVDLQGFLGGSMQQIRLYGYSYALGHSNVSQTRRKMASIPYPSHTLLMSEGGFKSLPADTPSAPCASQLDNTYIKNAAYNAAGKFTGGAHRGAGNILYLDGHIELFKDVSQLASPPYKAGGSNDLWAPGFDPKS